MATEASPAKNRKAHHFYFKVFSPCIWKHFVTYLKLSILKVLWFQKISLTFPQFANLITFCSLTTTHATSLLYLLTEIWNSFQPNNGTLQGGRVRFHSEHWRRSGGQISSPWLRPLCGEPSPHARSRSQTVPAEQIREVLALTSKIDFLIQLSQCPRWRLRADRANRAGA